MDAPSPDPSIFTATPEGFALADVVVRLARPDEYRKWDELVNQHHGLGFKRFAGRGLRYIVEWCARWIALAGWQSGAFKSRHRDRWIGWTEALRWRRLHLIANNTRFLVLGSKGVFPCLASFALAAMLRRLGDDWQTQYGHPMLIAESFVDPSKFDGTMYVAANWQYLGMTRGFARHNGRYTDPHGERKQLYVYPLRRDACRRLRDPGPLPPAWEPKGHAEKPPSELRSLYEELAAIEDFRRPQGRKHTVASTLSVYILARLANMRGPVAGAEYASKLSQRELEAIGAWKNPKTGRYVPVSKSTLHRVLSSVDPEQIEAALQRFSMPRLELARAIAIDGKRIRGAKARTDRGQPRRLHPQVAEQLVSLKTEHRALSVNALINSARERGIDHPLAPSTVHRLLSREGLLDKHPDDPLATDRRRFAFRDAGECWQSDVMHGPTVRDGRTRRKTYLIAFIDHADTRIMPRQRPGPLQARAAERGVSA